MQNASLWSEANSRWLAFALYFSVRYRYVYVKRDGGYDFFSLEKVCLLLGMLLLFFPRTHLSYLSLSIHPGYAVALAGFCMTIAGLAFSAWSRDVLGRYWSGRVIIQQDHRLVTAGPYAYVRHPLYTGLLVAMTGTALIWGDLGSLLGLLFAIGFFSLKAEREERILEAEFGAVYANYRARTGALLPRIAHV